MGKRTIEEDLNRIVVLLDTLKAIEAEIRRIQERIREVEPGNKRPPLLGNPIDPRNSIHAILRTLPLLACETREEYC